MSCDPFFGDCPPEPVPEAEPVVVVEEEEPIMLQEAVFDEFGKPLNAATAASA